MKIRFDLHGTVALQGQAAPLVPFEFDVDDVGIFVRGLTAVQMRQLYDAYPTRITNIELSFVPKFDFYVRCPNASAVDVIKSALEEHYVK